MSFEVTSTGRGVAHHGGLQAAHVRMDIAEARSLARELYALDGTDPTLPIPAVIPGADGRPMATITDAAALFPENATYIMRNADQCWAQLAWFLARSSEQSSGTFRDAPRLRPPDLEEAPT